MKQEEAIKRMEVCIECSDRDVLSAEISPPRETDDVQIKSHS